LRENHEYKAAKEMQKILMRRKSELESQLVRARGTDFSTAKDDAVTMGTHVCVMDLVSNNPESFTILGAWDSDPDKGVVSYLTPLAQALISKKVGETVEFDMDGAPKRYRIDRIETVQPAVPIVPPSTPSLVTAGVTSIAVPAPVVV